MADSTSYGTRAHLGQGWNFPVRPEHGRLPWASAEDDIDQAIGIILETARGERIMLPGFGAGLDQHVFAPNSPATHRMVENLVRRALIDWEPRITVENVTAAQSTDDPAVLLIEIDYRVRRSNAFYNRVYPFYLNGRT
jgi:phage baseplate assembly protein W